MYKRQVISESAFNDATGAIVTVGVLTVAMGTGEFSIAASLFDLLKQAVVGIVAGAVLGYLAALLIGHARWAFLAEYAPVVTLVAVIGAYFAADGLQASGFMAVFVFGIVIGNKDVYKRQVLRDRHVARAPLRARAAHAVRVLRLARRAAS